MGEFENQIDDKLKNFMSANYFEGNKPDAVNFWMGYEESVSSMHKDPY
jgi:phospholipase A2/jumonji domain-containing protein 7